MKAKARRTRGGNARSAIRVARCCGAGSGSESRDPLVPLIIGLYTMKRRRGYRLIKVNFAGLCGVTNRSASRIPLTTFNVRRESDSLEPSIYTYITELRIFFDRWNRWRVVFAVVLMIIVFFE